MQDVCKTCGLITDLCVCAVLDKEKATRIKVYTTKKKFKKLVTVVEGIEKNRLDDTASDLKHKFACGGTAKDGVIILQGNHKKRISEVLQKLGFPKENIEVS